jgi:hypothetical protein
MMSVAVNLAVSIEISIEMNIEMNIEMPMIALWGEALNVPFLLGLDIQESIV